MIWIVGDETKNGSESGTSFRQALYFLQCGFKLHDTMIYAKKNFIPLTHNRYEQSWEYMFCFSKGKPKTFNPIKIICKIAGDAYNYKNKGSNVVNGGYRRRNRIIKTASEKLHENIFYYSTGSSGTNHPAPFPEKLAHDQILSWSNEGDIVYDPFLGSGTTAKMAIINNRKFIGSEISSEYCKMASKRIPVDLFYQKNT